MNSNPRSFSDKLYGLIVNLYAVHIHVNLSVYNSLEIRINIIQRSSLYLYNEIWVMRIFAQKYVTRQIPWIFFVIFADTNETKIHSIDLHFLKHNKIFILWVCEMLWANLWCYSKLLAKLRESILSILHIYENKYYDSTIIRWLVPRISEKICNLCQEKKRNFLSFIQKKYDHMINYIWWVYLCNHDMGLALCSDLISSHVSNSDHNTTYMRSVIHIFHYGDNFLPPEEIIVSITQFIKIMRIKCFGIIR